MSRGAVDHAAVERSKVRRRSISTQRRFFDAGLSPPVRYFSRFIRFCRQLASIV
jgi:hypothetical protein